MTTPDESACQKCKRPFVPTDARWDGQARYLESAFCRSCVDRCHDNEIADHRCAVCHDYETGKVRR